MSEKISNILHLVEDADTKNKKVKLLKKNDSFVLRTILQVNLMMT